jgi:uncharacterized protein YggE
MRTLKVQGKGHVSTEPDMVTLSFDVEVRAWEYEECLSLLNERAEDLRQSMVESGLEKTQLKTSSFRVRVDTRYEEGQHIFNGYVASHRMWIKFPLDKVLLNEVLHHVAEGHSGAEIDLSFSVKDEDALRKRVLSQAVQAARENAEVLASAGGFRLGKLVQMDYGWSEVRIYNHEESFLCEDSSPLLCRADIEPEDVRAGDSVTLVYEIVD